jgi:hypothetical protein
MIFIFMTFWWQLRRPIVITYVVDPSCCPVPIRRKPAAAFIDNSPRLSSSTTSKTNRRPETARHLPQPDLRSEATQQSCGTYTGVLLRLNMHGVVLDRAFNMQAVTKNSPERLGGIRVHQAYKAMQDDDKIFIVQEARRYPGSRSRTGPWTT